MKRFLLALVALVFSSANSDAAIIFSIAPTVSSVPSGTNLNFAVSVRNDSGAAVLIDALDINVVAGAGDGSSGVFTSGTISVFPTGAWDFSTNGQAFFSGFQSGGASIGTSNQALGMLTLNTTGLADGNYTISLDSLAANSPITAAVPTSGTGTTFNISAVPEPASFVLVGLATAGFAVVRNRSRKVRSSLLGSA